MVFGKKKGGRLSLLTRGLYSEGKYRVMSLGGILRGLCREGVVSQSVLTVYYNQYFTGSVDIIV